MDSKGSLQPNLITKITMMRSDENSDQIMLDVDALRAVLNKPDHKNFPVVILSVVGPYRSGKSFLLNLFYHYLKRIEDKQCDPGEFDQREIPNVFFSKPGMDRITTDINILSQPFVLNSIENPDEKVAVFLMDTPGLFDLKDKESNDTVLGHISFFLSSKQFFNVKENIDSIHLESIYKFAEEAQKLSEKDHSFKPIQKESLIVVIRDFEEEDEYDLGLEGGKNFMESYLQSVNIRSAPEQKMMQHFLRNTYETIPCCLMPKPSRTVKKPSCSLSDIGEDFLEVLEEFRDFVLSKKNLMPKTFRGPNITCEELSRYLESFQINDGLKGETKNILQAATEAEISNDVTNAASTFLKEAIEKVKDNKDENERENIIEELIQEHLQTYERKKPSASKHRTDWDTELEVLLDQCGKATVACLYAREKYWEALKEFRIYKDKKIQRINLNKSYQKKLNPKKEELVRILREDIDPNIADQCCRYFEKDIDNIIEAKQNVDEIFAERKNAKVTNTFLGIGRMVAGGIGLAVGTAAAATGVGGVGGVPLKRKTRRYFKSRKKESFGKHAPSKSDDFSDLLSEEFALQKYGESEITFSLSFGTVKYPLSSLPNNGTQF